jgi:hypothetical protein
MSRCRSCLSAVQKLFNDLQPMGNENAKKKVNKQAQQTINTQVNHSLLAGVPFLVLGLELPSPLSAE